MTTTFKPQSTKHKVLSTKSQNLKPKTKPFSLVSKRYQRIDFRCAARGNVASEQCDKRQTGGHTDEGRGIGRRHPKEQSAEQPRQRQRADDADHFAGDHKSHALSQNQLHHVFYLRAERDAYPEFMRTLRDR